MKVLDAIKRIDDVKPNRFSLETKIGWLNDLDGMIFKEIVSTHEKPKITEFRKYTADNTDRELIVDDAYAEVYDHWLESKIDYYYGELDSYNTAISMYNNVYSSFIKSYRKDHLPIANNFEFTYNKGW